MSREALLSHSCILDGSLHNGNAHTTLENKHSEQLDYLTSHTRANQKTRTTCRQALPTHPHLLQRAAGARYHDRRL